MLEILGTGQGYVDIYTLNLRLPLFFPECFYPGLYSLGSKFEKLLQWLHSAKEEKI